MDLFVHDVYHVESSNEITCVLEPSSLLGESIIRVSYTARIAGTYIATFAVNNQLIGGEFRRQYIPGNRCYTNHFYSPAYACTVCLSTFWKYT